MLKINDYINTQFLETLSLYGVDINSEEVAIAMFFDGSLESILLLNLLLRKTKCKIKIYSPNRLYLRKLNYRKITLENIDNIVEVTDNILSTILDNNREFKIYKALERLKSETMPEIQTVFDELRFHIVLSDSLQSVMSYFDYFILHQHPVILQNSFAFSKILKLNEKLSYNINIIPIFQLFHIENFTGNIIKYIGVNILRLREFSSSFISFKELDARDNLTKDAIQELYIYLAFKKDKSLLIDFVERFYKQIDKAVHIKLLEEVIPIKASNSMIINHIATFANLSSIDILNIFKKLLYKITLLDADLENKESFIEVNTFLNIFYNKISPNNYLSFFKESEVFGMNSYEILDRLILAKCHIEEYLLDLVVRNGIKRNKILEHNIFYIINNYFTDIDDIVKKECFILALKTEQLSICAKIHKLFNKLILPLNKYDNIDIIKSLEISKNINFSYKELDANSRIAQKILELLLKELGSPQNKIKNIIYVTGTAGKTSVALNIKNILEELGYSVNMSIFPVISNIHETIIVENRQLLLEEIYQYFYEVIDVWNKIQYIEEYRTIFESIDRKMPVELFHIIVSIIAMSKVNSNYSIIESYSLGKLQLANIFSEATISLTVLNKLLLLNKHDIWDYVPDMLVTKLGHLSINSEIITAKQELIIDKNIDIYKDRNNFTIIKEKDNWEISKEKGKYKLYFRGLIYDICEDKFEYYDVENLILAFMSLLLGSKFTLDHNKLEGLLKNNKLEAILELAKNNINYVMKQVNKDYFSAFNSQFYNDVSLWFGLLKNQVATVNLLNYIEYKHYEDIKYFLLDIDVISSDSINIITILLNSCTIDHIYIVSNNHRNLSKIEYIINSKNLMNKNIKLFLFVSSAMAEIKSKINKYSKDSKLLFAIASIGSDFLDKNLLLLLKDILFDKKEADFLYDKKIINKFALKYLSLQSANALENIDNFAS